MINIPDVINSSFELLGTFAILGHVHRLWKDKNVAGVSLWATVFFASWGFWNLYYYPHLGQWWSFWGGIGIVLANIIWISGMVYYSRHPGGK